MPITSKRFGLLLPLGNEFASREVLVKAFETIDEKALLDTDRTDILDKAKKYTDDLANKPNGYPKLDVNGKVGTGQLPKRKAIDIDIQDAKGYYPTKNVEAALQQIGAKIQDMSVSIYRSNKDENGIYRTIEWKTKNNVLRKRSVISVDANGNYDKQTITKFAEDGITVAETEIYKYSLDGDGDIVNEVLQ